LGSAGLHPPPEVAEALFAAISVRGRQGVLLEEFLCCLAMLRHGLREQRLRLIFSVYDRERRGSVLAKDLKSFADALAGTNDVSECTSSSETRDVSSSSSTRNRCSSKDALAELTAPSGCWNWQHRVLFADFAAWARRHLGEPLVNWLLVLECQLTGGHPCQGVSQLA